MSIEHQHLVILKAANGQACPVRLKVNPNARRILIRIDSQNREAVAIAPSSRKTRAALAFAEERVAWIAEKLAEIPERQSLAIGDKAPFRNVMHLIAPADSGRSVRVDMTGNEPRFLVPGPPDAAPARVKGFLRAAARNDIADRVRRHAKSLKVQPRGIAIKDTRSRWGSCSSAGNLNFSWRLICAPTEVLDYVAAHECAHLREMNHSTAFWGLVKTCSPDFERHRAWLRANGRLLHQIGAD